MALAEVALHLGAAQIEVAVLQAQILGGGLALADRNGGGGEEFRISHSVTSDFDFAGRQFGIDGTLGAAHDLAFHREEKLGAHRARDLMRGGIVRRIEDELDDSLAIAQIDKDEPAMIAARLDPSPQSDLAARIGGAQRAAVISALPRRQRRILFSFPSPIRVEC